jgi:two-component system, NarL family, nitrate/nitrite response regulator NarL
VKTTEHRPPSHLTMTRQHLTAPASGFLNGAEKAAGITPMVIIEPNPLLRDGLGRLLQETRYQVIGSSGSFANLVVPPNSSPEIALIGGDESALAVRALEDCRKAFPSARRVVLNDAQGEHLTSILTAGAHACLGRDVTLQALLMTLDLAMLGASLVCRPAGFSTNPLH